MENGVELQRAKRRRVRFQSEEDILFASRIPGRSRRKLYGKNKFAWETQVADRRSDRMSTQSNADEYEADLAGEARELNEIEAFWDLLFSKEIIDIIVERTNARIKEESAKGVSDDKSYQYDTDAIEIRAFIGVLYYAGLWKSCHVDVKELWNKSNGIPFYRCVFARNRFGFLQACLRFDVPEDRVGEDRFSPVRKIWDIFIENCRRNYSPSSICTVDEQLLSFRGRCIFRMYIKSKPDKYGLKMLTLNDATTSYLIFALPYLGKNAKLSNPDKLPVSELLFQEVTKPIHGTNRSVTCDNWFTSIPLVLRMLKTPFNMTMTGTLKKNKREVPLEMKIAGEHPPQTKFCHTREMCLLSYTPKKKKIVLVLSSHMKTTEITNGKPNIVLFYNDTKGGTDTFDQLCHAYTVARRSNRWPLRFFFGMLDQAAVNARILWKISKDPGTKREKTAIIALRKLISYLVAPQLKKRQESEYLRKELRINIQGILDGDEGDEQSHDLEKISFNQAKRCKACPRKDDKKSKFGCSSCRAPVCEKHRYVLCDDCCGK